MNWLNSSAINKSEIAKRLGVTPALFSNKMKNNQYKRFTSKELARLEEIRKDLIAELSA